MSFFASAMPLCWVPSMDDGSAEAQLWSDGMEFRVLHLPPGAVGVQHEVDTGFLDLNFNYALTHVPHPRGARFVSIRRIPSRAMSLREVQDVYLSGMLRFDPLRYGLYISRTKYAGGEILPLLVPNGRGRLLLDLRAGFEREEGPASPSWTAILCRLGDAELDEMTVAADSRGRLKRSLAAQWASALASLALILGSLYLIVLYASARPDRSWGELFWLFTPWAIMVTVLTHVVPDKLTRWVLRREGRLPQGRASKRWF